jgi:hypothetical protein
LFFHNTRYTSLIACNLIFALELWHSQSHAGVCFAVEASRWLPFDAETDASPSAADNDDDDAADDACLMIADTIRLLLLPRTRLFRAASLAGEPIAAGL